jgi:hypothetical protein
MVIYKGQALPPGTGQRKTKEAGLKIFLNN